MGTWSRGAPLLSVGSAADPEPGRSSPGPAGSGGTGCDAARSARRPGAKARPGQHAQPLDFDPDDAKTVPRPAVSVPPGEHAQPPGLDPGEAKTAREPAGPAGLRPPRPQQEPPWSTVIATTLRLWWERRGRPLWRGWRRRRRLWAGAAALAVVVVAAGLAVALPRSGREAPGRHHAGGGEATGRHRAGGGMNPVLSAQAVRSDAAAWIDRQVSRGTIVSCDPVMCSALLAAGFPAANLDSLRPSAPDPLASDVIAATAVLRGQFGSRLTSVYAPITVASFGTGSAEVAVRVVAPDGSPAYLRQFRADLAARKAYGAQMLRNSKIVVAPAARRQLASGMVDARLLVTISTAAHRENPLRIVSFGAAAPGASSGVPVRSAVIASTASGPKASTAVLDKLRRFWLGQQAPYHPASTQIVPGASGQSVLRIQFAAPSQLGLLSAGHPVVKTPR